MIDNGFEINIMLGGDGEYESVIKDLCNKLDLNNYVKFCGRVDNTGTFFDSIDILAAPSLSEGFSNTILEAMSYGIPVVGSEVGGIPEQVFDNETGLLFECGNVEKLYNALVALVKDKEKREQLGTNARTVVEERFTVDKMAENMIEAFEKICN
jgi:glycosyltransferase involved in cell wall biosynthesis